VIANLSRFIERRTPLWEEYEALLSRLEQDVALRLALDELQRLRYLHESVAGDLSRIQSVSSDPPSEQYLESLLARGFGYVHDGRRRSKGLSWLKAPLCFAQVFRANLRLFLLVFASLLLGATFGGIAVTLDPGVKEVFLPFPHLLGDPSQRVAMEEEQTSSVKGLEQTFAAQLMTHNIRVSILCMVLGFLGGVFTLVLVFYNGVILGAICVDYILAGESRFLAGWLLPHGSVEIPAILFSAMAGLVLARALLFRQGRLSLRGRFRRIRGTVVTLISGVAVFLVWAGIIESFFSQYHEPTLPYTVKILFGLTQLILLIAFLCFSPPPKEELP